MIDLGCQSYLMTENVCNIANIGIINNNLYNVLVILTNRAVLNN